MWDTLHVFSPSLQKFLQSVCHVILGWWQVLCLCLWSTVPAGLLASHASNIHVFVKYSACGFASISCTWVLSQLVTAVHNNSICWPRWFMWLASVICDLWHVLLRFHFRHSTPTDITINKKSWFLSTLWIFKNSSWCNAKLKSGQHKRIFLRDATPNSEWATQKQVQHKIVVISCKKNSVLEVCQKPCGLRERQMQVPTQQVSYRHGNVVPTRKLAAQVSQSHNNVR